jgi:hypothetical protein
MSLSMLFMVNEPSSTKAIWGQKRGKQGKKMGQNLQNGALSPKRGDSGRNTSFYGKCEITRFYLEQKKFLVKLLII